MKLLVLGATGATGRLVAGQATDPADVTQAMAGVDAVISTLGAAKDSVLTDATRAIIAGAAASGVLLRGSDLDWTIVHSVRLANGPATGRARVVADSVTLRMGDSVARADVAAYLLAAVTDQTTSRRAVAIAG
jgi:uncharacterized protein YbjT (DUF2867 family)